MLKNLIELFKLSKIVVYSEPELEYVNPCRPSPCGPNSQCRDVNGQAVCSCLPSYFGSPPACRPECVTSAECGFDKACVNQKCVDPCPGRCGTNAVCRVNNHSPLCTCLPGYTGNAFTICSKIPRKFVFTLWPDHSWNVITKQVFLNSAPSRCSNREPMYSFTLRTKLSMHK